MSGISITFGDGNDWATVAKAIPRYYTVALLRDGDEVHDGILPGVDVCLVDVTGDGLVVQDLVASGPREGDAKGPTYVRDWDSFDRIHVY